MQAARRRPQRLKHGGDSTNELYSEDAILHRASLMQHEQIASAMGFGNASLTQLMAVPSLLGPLMCRAQGVVAQAPTDFTMGALLPYTTLPPMSAHSIALSPI